MVRKMKAGIGEDHTRQNLDQQIAGRNAATAARRTASKHQPAENRKIETPRNVLTAFTARSWKNQGLLKRDTMDANVQEASNNGPENKKADSGQPRICKQGFEHNSRLC